MPCQSDWPHLARSGHSLLRRTSRVALTAPRSFSIGGIVRKRQFETTFLVAENAALVASARIGNAGHFDGTVKDWFGWSDFLAKLIG
jgi:hypothetical protein